MKDIHTEEYICEECGNTTPVPNDFCPSCGSPMTPLHATPDKAKPEEEEDDNDFSKLHDGIGEETGEESLEALRADEEKESEDEYTGGFNDADIHE